MPKRNYGDNPYSAAPKFQYLPVMIISHRLISVSGFQLQIRICRCLCDTPRGADVSCTSLKANLFCRFCLARKEDRSEFPSAPAPARDVAFMRTKVASMEAMGRRSTDTDSGVRPTGSPYLAVADVCSPGFLPVVRFVLFVNYCRCCHCCCSCYCRPAAFFL
jgi:hypothetical protein